MGVTVRQKVKGKGQPWWVFVAYNNKRTSRRVGDKDAAEKVASNIRARLELGEFEWEEKEDAPEPTFKEYADSWISTIAPATCKESTVSSYDDLLRLHILPVFGTLKLKEINRGRMKDFFAGKILDGFAESSVKHMRNAISGILNKAVDDEVLSNNVALRIGKITQKTKGNGDEESDSAVADPLTKEETALLLDTAAQHWPKDYPLVLLLFRTGVRIGEAMALKWADVDFNSRFIHVQRGLSRMKIQTPKSGKTRRVDMSPQLAEALLAHRKECKEKGLALGFGDAPEYVFTNEKGTFIDVNNWRRRVFNKALEKAKLRRIRIHDARHTYATLRLSKGDNITDVSKQLGHCSVKLTLDIYNHWLPGGKKSEVDALDDVGFRKNEEKKAANEGALPTPVCTPLAPGHTLENQLSCNPLISLVGGTGIEPVTSGL
jgi:integrase